jgi:hypothetical protein
MMREQIATAHDAARLLEEHCGCLVVQLEIEPPRWKVVGRDRQFEAVYSPLELIEFARAQCRKHHCVDERGSCDTFEEALDRLRDAGREVIVTDGGFVLRGISAENHDVELTCDSEADLIAYAANLPSTPVRLNQTHSLVLGEEVGADAIVTVALRDHTSGGEALCPCVIDDAVSCSTTERRYRRT